MKPKVRTCPLDACRTVQRVIAREDLVKGQSKRPKTVTKDYIGPQSMVQTFTAPFSIGPDCLTLIGVNPRERVLLDYGDGVA